MTRVMEPATGDLRAQVAEEVRALMARRRISGVQLSKEIGRSNMYLSRRLNGSTPFDVDDLEAFARIFEVPVTALFGTPATPARGVGLDQLVNPTTPGHLLRLAERHQPVRSRYPSSGIVNHVRPHVAEPRRLAPSALCSAAERCA